MLILGAHPLRQIEQRAEASFQRRIAINIALMSRMTWRSRVRRNRVGRPGCPGPILRGHAEAKTGPPPALVEEVETAVRPRLLVHGDTTSDETICSCDILVRLS